MQNRDNIDLIFRNPKIYLICGKARHGKTTTAKIIKEYFKEKNVIITPYAKYLRMYAKDIFGWDGNEESKPRELLQVLGTDIIRNALNKPLFFVNRMCEDIEIISYFCDVIIIDDVRTPDEIDIPRSKFDNVFSIKIERNNFETDLTEKQQKDFTEIALNNYNNYDFVIENNGSLEDLKSNIVKILND